MREPLVHIRGRFCGQTSAVETLGTGVNHIVHVQKTITIETRASEIRQELQDLLELNTDRWSTEFSSAAQRT